VIVQLCISLIIEIVAISSADKGLFSANWCFANDIGWVYMNHWRSNEKLQGSLRVTGELFGALTILAFLATLCSVVILVKVPISKVELRKDELSQCMKKKYTLWLIGFSWFCVLISWLSMHIAIEVEMQCDEDHTWRWWPNYAMYLTYVNTFLYSVSFFKIKGFVAFHSDSGEAAAPV